MFSNLFQKVTSEVREEPAQECSQIVADEALLWADRGYTGQITQWLWKTHSQNACEHTMLLKNKWADPHVSTCACCILGTVEASWKFMMHHEFS